MRFARRLLIFEASANILLKYNRMSEEDKNFYNQTLSDYSNIIRNGGNSLDQISKCIERLEKFEDYEKCRDLFEILKAYETKNDKNTE
jgi:hypothetical protein